MTMLNKSDDYIQNRLIWKARKYSLPLEYSFFYSDLSPEIKKYLSVHINTESAGMPVLFFTRPSKEWSLLCTQELIGFNNYDFYSLPLKEISYITCNIKEQIEVSEDSQKVKQLVKAEWYKLAVKNKNEQVFSFYTYKGPDLFALWNILLMAVRLYP